MNSKSNTWDEEKISKLTKLWNQKPRLSTSEIANLLGVTKNAIAGKINRLGISNRKVATIQKLSLEDLGNNQCLWPEGDPSESDFYFCGEQAQLGRAYCEKHIARAYIKPNKQRREIEELSNIDIEAVGKINDDIVSEVETDDTIVVDVPIQKKPIISDDDS